MSRAATFELQTKMTTEELKKLLETLWYGDSVDIIPHGDLISIQLQYFTNRPNELDELLNITNQLLAISTTKQIFYLRDNVVADGLGSVYHRVLSPKDLLLPKFEPGMHNGPQYRYVVKP